MNIHPIRTKAEYKRALLEVSTYFDNEPEPGSEDGDRFEMLVAQVEEFEAIHEEVATSFANTTPNPLR